MLPAVGRRATERTQDSQQEVRLKTIRLLLRGWLARPSPVLSLPPMHMLSHPSLSGPLFPLSLLPPLPRCPSFPCPLRSPLSLLVWLLRPVWLCCSCVLLLLPHPPPPPHEDFTSPHDVDCPTRGGLVTRPAATPVASTPLRVCGAAPDLPPPPPPARGDWVPRQPLLNRHRVGGVSCSPKGLLAQHEGGGGGTRGRPAWRGRE